MSAPKCPTCGKTLAARTISRPDRTGYCKAHERARGRSPEAMARQAHRVRMERQKARRVLKRVSAETGVHKRDILGDYRFDFAVNARAVASVVMQLRGMSLAAIGRALRRDHTSIRHLVVTFPTRAVRKPELAALVERLAA